MWLKCIKCTKQLKNFLVKLIFVSKWFACPWRTFWYCWQYMAMFLPLRFYVVKDDKRWLNINDIASKQSLCTNMAEHKMIVLNCSWQDGDWSTGCWALGRIRSLESLRHIGGVRSTKCSWASPSCACTIVWKARTIRKFHCWKVDKEISEILLIISRDKWPLKS